MVFSKISFYWSEKLKGALPCDFKGLLESYMDIHAISASICLPGRFQTFPSEPDDEILGSRGLYEYNPLNESRILLQLSAISVRQKPSI
jgi:hypothetical protein